MGDVPEKHIVLIKGRAIANTNSSLLVKIFPFKVNIFNTFWSKFSLLLSEIIIPS